MDKLDLIVHEVRENRKAIEKLERRVRGTELKVYTFTFVIAFLSSQIKTIIGVFK